MKTALEWYSDKLLEILGDNVNLFTKEQTLANHYALEQGKEMEKQQSIDFACEVYNSHYYRDTKSFKQVSEEHYIKTYKKQQNG
jgi:hypothetical protein